MLRTLNDWQVVLGNLAAGRGVPADQVGVFADESGHRRAVDRPLLAWLQRDSGSPAERVEVSSPADPDVLLWAALAGGQDVPAQIWEVHANREHRSSYDQGSLFPQRNRSGPIAIEVWSEVELSSLHALSWFAESNRELRPVVRAAATWHIENLQPDNATNHPWAVHVFAAIGIANQNPDATMYAQTLMHNCQVSLGRPDAFSALILKDAADALRSSSIADWIATA